MSYRTLHCLANMTHLPIGESHRIHFRGSGLQSHPPFGYLKELLIIMYVAICVAIIPPIIIYGLLRTFLSSDTAYKIVFLE